MRGRLTCPWLFTPRPVREASHTSRPLFTEPLGVWDLRRVMPISLHFRYKTIRGRRENAQ